MTALAARSTAPDLRDTTPLRAWLAVTAVALAVFALMTTELLPVGLLTPMSAGLGVSEGAAGLTVTVPGLAAAAAAPILTVLTGRLDRRLVLIALAALVAVANAATAVADGFAVVLAVRVLVGVSIGGFWSIAGGVALRLVAPRHVPRATAVVYGGIGAATVLGVPAGTVVGDLAGWRAAFWAVAVLAVIALVGVVVLVPRLPSTGAVRFADLPGLLRDRSGVRTGLALTLLIVTGHFLAYTFVRPILESRGVPDDRVGVLLLVFGVAGLVGTLAAGALVGRHLRRTVIGLAVAMSAAMALLAFAVTGTAAAAAVLLLWGLGYGLVSPAVQTWYLRAAPDRAEVATSINTFAYNLGIGLGSLAGGVVFNAVGGGVLWIGGALVAAVLLVVVGRNGAPAAHGGGARRVPAVG